MGEVNRRQIRMCFASAPLGGCITGVQSQTLLQQHHHCCSPARKNPPHPPQPQEFQASSRTLLTACSPCLLREHRLSNTFIGNSEMCTQANRQAGGCQGRAGTPQEAPAPGAQGYLQTPGGPARRCQLCWSSWQRGQLSSWQRTLMLELPGPQFCWLAPLSVQLG